VATTTHYEQLKKLIEKAPLTYLPALLTIMVKTCVKSKMFVPGGIEKIVAKAIQEVNYPKGNHD
jgi:hypothetical protein